MRSTPATKMAKPPPPVPPRPSKTIIAEALAKTKKVAEAGPLRVAPSPPVAAKPTDAESVSRSNSSVNVLLKKPVLDRSISEEIKTTTRTIVFQSSSMNKSSSKIQVSQNCQIVNDSASNESANNAHSEMQNAASDNNSVVNPVSESSQNKLDKNWNEILNDRNHVNTLIDEMFASVLEIPDDTPVETTNNFIVHNENKKEREGGSDQKKQPTVLVINQNVDDDCSSKTSGDDCKSNSSTSERKHVKFDDKQNHELLISELESMKQEQQRILKRQRKPSQEIYDENALPESPKIQHSDWVEVNNGEEVRLSSCQITIEDFKKTESSKVLEDDIISRLATMSSLHGLPPLPKSLSGFSLLEDSALSNAPGSSRGATPPAGHYSPHSKAAVNGNDVSPNLDVQLAILRREMVSLLLLP